MFWIETALQESIPELLSWNEDGYMILDVGKICKVRGPQKNASVFIMDRVAEIRRDVNRLLCPEKSIEHVDVRFIDRYAVNAAIVYSRCHGVSSDIFKKTMSKISVKDMRDMRCKMSNGIGNNGIASIYRAIQYWNV